MLLVRLLHPTKHLVSGVTAAVLAACALYCQNATDLLAQARKLYDQGDRYRAAPLFARAEQQFRLAHDRRNEFAAKFGRLHSDADHGNYKAVKAEIETDLKSPTVQADPQLKIQALALLGIIDLNIDTVAAGSDWKQVLETATAAGDKKWQNRARGELAIVAGLNGNIAAAGAGLLKAIAVAEQIGDTGGAINFRIWLANGMTVNGMADSALKQLDKATELATHSGYRQLPFQLSIARLRAIAMLPEPARAEHLLEAQNLFRSTLQQAQAEHVYGAQIELWNQQGQLALGSEKLTLAEKSLLEAWSVARQAGLAGLGAEADLHLAQLYLQMRQPRKAEASIKRGMQEIAGAEEGYDFPLFVAAEADVQAALRHAKRADALYQHATTLLEGLLVNAPSSQVKSSMVNAFSRIYVSHFRLVWAQEHDAAKALQIIENARARVLLDSMLYTRRVHTVAAESPEEIKIAQLQRKLIRQKVSESEAKQILRQLDEAYDQLGEANAAQERKEAAFLRHPPAVLPVVRNLLGEREVLLEYVLARDASYCLELSRSGLQVHQLPDRGQITRMTRAYLGALKSNRDGGADARALYSTLIAPVHPEKWDSMIVVPDGNLHLLPFGALSDERGKFLAERTTLSVAPSATVWSALKAEPEIAISKPFLGVAFSRAPEQNVEIARTRGIADLRGADIKPLQFSLEEVTEADRALGGAGAILKGAEASEAALKSEPLGQFKVIHLSAHGVGDESEPDRAALVLNPGNSVEDGLWQAREIRHTRLNADVVVLSACETGTGRLQGEEGIMNLARAFLTAGAKSVVASLWDVEDRSTATLMEGFYQHLARGESVDLALRSAQVDFLKTYGVKASPFLWAGFEVIGDGTRRIVGTTKAAKLQAARANLR